MSKIETSETIETEIDFDDILTLVDDDGTFQRRFNYLFNFGLIFCLEATCFSLFMILAVPEHWCHVPGAESSGLEEWKKITIPNKSSNENEFESCKMYSNHSSIQNCAHGWDYDKTWYSSTVPTTFNWVCDDEINVANAFLFQKIGDVFGCLIFSLIGDAFGRKLAFYSTIATMLLGRFSLLFTPKIISLFMLSCFISGMGISTVQPPQVIAMEISNRKRHAFIAMLQSVSRVLGCCTVPLLMWLLRDWVSLLLVTTFPIALFLFMGRFVVESPRWLFSKSKKEQCARELKKIARVNEIELTDEFDALIEKGCKKEKSLGLWSLFSHWRLIKNTFIYVYILSSSNLIHFLLTLNVDKMGGNPFMNFFWQSIVEVPSYVLGKLSCDKLGRKWTVVLGYLGTFVGCVSVSIYYLTTTKYEWVPFFGAVFIKFCVSSSYFTINLLALEMHPTTLRQTGVSAGGIIANSISSSGPYIVYLGTEINIAFPFIVSSLLALFSIILGLFLPETLDEKLPEDLNESHRFGKGQPIWYFPKLNRKQRSFQLDIN